MGNGTSSTTQGQQQQLDATTTTTSFSTNVTVQLLGDKQSESELLPGDVINGNLVLECTSQVVNSTKGNGFPLRNNHNNNSEAHHDHKLKLLFLGRYQGIMVTVTGVEYAISNEGDSEQQELVVLDNYKLGRFIEFPNTQQGEHEQQQQQQNNATANIFSMEYPFEIELPQSSSREVEMINMDELLMNNNNNNNHQRPNHDDDDDNAVPDAIVMDDDSSCDEDDDYEHHHHHHRWEMLSEKRHSLSPEEDEDVRHNNSNNNNNFVRKQYAYKIKAVLQPRQPQQQHQ